MVFVQAAALRDSGKRVNERSGITGHCEREDVCVSSLQDLVGKDPFRPTLMSKPRRIGFVRVSTPSQLTDRQVIQLEECCDELRIEHTSAVAKKRPVFDQLLQDLQSGDTLVVVDLDRAFRSAIDALLTAQNLRERGIAFDMLTFPIDVTSEMGEVFYGILALFAQFERRIIRRRTKEGLDAARRRGVRLGRPTKLSNKVIEDAYAWMQETGLPCRYVAALLGVPRLTLQRGFHRLGLKYPLEHEQRKQGSKQNCSELLD